MVGWISEHPRLAITIPKVPGAVPKYIPVSRPHGRDALSAESKKTSQIIPITKFLPSLAKILLTNHKITPYSLKLHLLQMLVGVRGASNFSLSILFVEVLNRKTVRDIEE